MRFKSVLLRRWIEAARSSLRRQFIRLEDRGELVGKLLAGLLEFVVPAVFGHRGHHGAGVDHRVVGVHVVSFPPGDPGGELLGPELVGRLVGPARDGVAEVRGELLGEVRRLAPRDVFAEGPERLDRRPLGVGSGV